MGVGLVFGDGEDVRELDPVRAGLEDRATAIQCAKALVSALDRAVLPASLSDVDPATSLGRE